MPFDVFLTEDAERDIEDIWRCVADGRRDMQSHLQRRLLR